MSTVQDTSDNSKLRKRGQSNMVPRASHNVEYRRLPKEDEDDSITTIIPRANIPNKAKNSNIQLADFVPPKNSSPFSDESPPWLSDDVSDTRDCESFSETILGYDDRKTLLPHRDGLHLDKCDKSVAEETSCMIALQISFPFLIAGLGMVAAGLVLDKVQEMVRHVGSSDTFPSLMINVRIIVFAQFELICAHWEVFQKVSEVFILVPALLGLKGNLEMTLASRLSTVAHLGHLDDHKKKWSIIAGNMILVEAQAMVVAFVASLVAMVLGWIPDGKWETNHALILCAGSLLTGAIASGVLGAIMIFVILMSRKCGVNPDNVATPIAASLGDLTTLSLLSGIAMGLYNILLDPSKTWIVWSIIVVFIVLTPVTIYFSYRNEHTRDVIQNGWFPILAAMGISSVGGFILDFAVSANPGIAVFSPVINGVGGNFVAVQASRISTYLHKSEHRLGSLPSARCCDCTTPCVLYCGNDNPHARSARVMTFLAIPGQLLFLLVIAFLNAGHTTITPQFVLVYVIVSLVQVTVLLYVCHCLVHRLWRTGQDPDNCAIPYLTALGDLLGTGMLGLGFLFLWSIGDRDQDVGD